MKKKKKQRKKNKEETKKALKGILIFKQRNEENIERNFNI